MNENSGIAEEMNSLTCVRKPMYSADLLRYAILQQYTPLSLYKLLLNELKLPSVSFLQKVTVGEIESTATARLLKDHGNISQNVLSI